MQPGQLLDFGGLQYTNQHPMSLCNPDTTLWMGDLKPEWGPEFIKECFRQYAPTIRNVKMVTDRSGTRPASYCFVEFNDSDSARKAMLGLIGKPVSSEHEKIKFNLSFANAPNQNAEYNLFATNLSSSVDDVALFLFFGEKYPSCRGARVYRNPDGSSREFGFVRFTDETDQQTALLEMNKQRLKGKEIVLRLAKPKEQNHRGGGRDRGGGRYTPRSYNGISSGHYNDRDGRPPRSYNSMQENGYGSSRSSSTYPQQHYPPRSSSGGNAGGMIPMAAGGGMLVGQPMMGLVHQPMVGMAGGIAPQQQPYMVNNHGMAGFGAPMQQQLPHMAQPTAGYGGGAAAPLMHQNMPPSAVAPQFIVSAPTTWMEQSIFQYPTAALMPHQQPGGAIQYQNGAATMIPATDDPRLMHPGSVGGTFITTPMTSVPTVIPAPLYFEGEEPMTADEHNQLVMSASADFLTTLESSRWSRVMVPMNARTKEINVMLNA